MQVVFIIVMFKYQNTAGSMMVCVPNNWRAVSSGVHPRIDKDNGQLSDQLGELHILKHNINPVSLSLVCQYKLKTGRVYFCY